MGITKRLKLLAKSSRAPATLRMCSCVWRCSEIFSLRAACACACVAWLTAGTWTPSQQAQTQSGLHPQLINVRRKGSKQLRARKTAHPQARPYLPGPLQITGKRSRTSGSRYKKGTLSLRSTGSGRGRPEEDKLVWGLRALELELELQGLKARLASAPKPQPQKPVPKGALPAGRPNKPAAALSPRSARVCRLAARCREQRPTAPRRAQLAGREQLIDTTRTLHKAATTQKYTNTHKRTRMMHTKGPHMRKPKMRPQPPRS